MPDTEAPTSRPARRLLAPFVVILLVAATLASLYVDAMRARTGGHLSLPLDDGYIYLQYARRLAEGHPLSYTSGAPPSTGATSWLHTMLLAVPFLSGADGEDAIWGSIVLGALYLAIAAALTFVMVRVLVPGRGGGWWAAGAATVVLLNVTLLHAAFSGMDTALYAAGLLVAAFALCRPGETPRWGYVAAALLAWVRPEGLLMGGLAMLMFRRTGMARVRAIALAGLLACVPFVVGWILTGTPKSDVLALKGIFSVPWSSGRADLLADRPANWLRQVTWLATNFRNPGQQTLVQGLLCLGLGAAVVAAMIAAWRRGVRAIALLGGVLLLGVLATSLSWFTLARYTAPYLPAFAVVVTFGLAQIVRAIPSRPARAGAGAMVVVLGAAFVWSPLAPVALDQFSWNCENSHNQQRRVGDWLRENTPADAIVAVNDAGAIAYFSQRRTLDLVGLTSHGWGETSHVRPGATFEKLENLPADERPDILAVYDEVFPNLLRTGLVDELVLVADLENNTINLSRTKAVCSTNWKRAADRRSPQATVLGERAVADAVNVADLENERAHAYGVDGRSGSMVLDLPSGSATGPRVLDGGRAIEGAETFTVSVTPGRDVTMVARVMADAPFDVPVAIDGAEVARLRAPAAPGVWTECSALLPAASIRDGRMALTIGGASRNPAGPASARQVAYYWFLQ